MPPVITKDKVQKELAKMVSREKTSVMSEEDRKAQEEAVAKKAKEATKAKEQKAKDDAILAKKEEERSKEEKERAGVIQKQRQEEEKKRKEEEEAKLPADEKVKRIQEKTQKRIDELSAELKGMHDQRSTEANDLKAEMETLRLENERLKDKPREEPLKDKLAKTEKERISKYTTEDTDKPKEQRREMSKAELDDWYLEDAVSVTDWLNRRLLRRERERELDIRRITADELEKKQQESLQRVFIKHPELNIKTKIEALKAQGKSEVEIKELMKNSIEKLKKLTEIVKSNPNYLSAEDGPEEAIAALETSTPAASDSDKKIDELTSKVEELSSELAAIRNSDEGINSTILTPNIDKKKLTAHEQELVSTMKSAGASEESIKSALKKFRISKGLKE